MLGKRLSFSIYRHGESAVVGVLNPGSLYTYTRSLQPQDSLRSVRSTSAQIDFSLTGSSTLRVGDLLKDGTYSRWFLVVQLTEDKATRRALVAEVSSPIPDEFESGVIDKWWTASGGWAVDNTVGELALDGTGWNMSNMLAAEHCSQSVEGDFDVYTWLKADAGSSGAKRYALLKASMGDLTDGVAVGIESGANSSFCRVDYVDGSGGQVVSYGNTDLLNASFRYVRLKREGIRFRCFYANSTALPTKETEWTEIPPASWVYTNKQNVTVGPAGYVTTAAAIVLRWRFVRNWKDELAKI